MLWAKSSVSLVMALSSFTGRSAFPPGLVRG